MNILTRNNVRVFGAGDQAMLFAHGFGCDQTMWRFITPAFEEKFRIVLFDYVGCGQSDKSYYDPMRYSDLEGYAQDVLDVCHALKLKDAIFVGHSVSAMIGMLAANQRPGLFSKMVMLGPSACYINDLPHYEGGFDRSSIDGLLEAMEAGNSAWAENLGAMVMGNPERPELASELISLFCELDPEVAQQFARATFCADNRQELPGMKLPTLVVQTSDDIVAPPAAVGYVHQNIPGSRLTMLQARGHVPQMSAPDETIKALKDFLDGGKS
jgi:sigma-B regulation protein RsbQ